MKRKRIVVCWDSEWERSQLGVVLRTHGYEVLPCADRAECDCLLRARLVDALVIGACIASDHNESAARYEGELAIVHRRPDDNFAQLIERLRVALIRKRGPRKAPASTQVCSNAARGDETNANRKPAGGAVF